MIEISHKVALSNSNSALDLDSDSNLKSKSSASSSLTSVNCSFTEARSQSRRMKMIAAFHDQIVKLKVMISYLQFFAAIVLLFLLNSSFASLHILKIEAHLKNSVMLFFVCLFVCESLVFR